MAGFTKAKVSGSGGPRKDILASLKMAQIEILKPALPAEIMSFILDYLAPSDLIRVARTSKFMQEMVYDDTRWVQRLKRMGCWNDTQARKQAEKSHGQLDIRTKKVLNPPLSDVPDRGVASRSTDDQVDHTGGFDVTELATSQQSYKGSRVEGAVALTVLHHVQSIRGKAREAYGKIHAALNPFYEDIVRSDVSTGCLVFTVYGTPEQQAQLLAALQRFAKCDRSLGWHDREQRILDAVSLFETAALREFRNGYETRDVDGLMRRYAHVLVTLNGGDSAVELFIHHNHLVTKKADFGTPMDCINRSSGAVSLEHTQAFLTRLNVAYNEEVSTIDRCFPPSIDLPTLFLNKIGNDVLSPFFTTLFDEVHTGNIRSYLSTVSGTFAQTINFVRGLQAIQHSGDEFYEAAERIIERTFEPHLDLYLAEELDQFRKNSDVAVSDWDRRLSEQAATAESFYMSNVNRQADKKDFLTSFKKVLMVPVNILPNFSAMMSNGAKEEGTRTPTGNPATRSQNGSRPSVPTGSQGSLALPLPSTSGEIPTTELTAKAAIMNSKLEGIRSLFSIEVALNLIHEAKSSLERTAQFVKLQGEFGKVAQQQCEAIFVSLLHILGHRHVIAGFDKAVDHLSSYQPRQHSKHEKPGVEPLVTFLELVNVGDLILQMVDVFYEQELVGAKLTDRSDFLDPAVKEKRKFEQMLDERVAAGLSKGIDVLVDEVEYLLATKQVSTDFNPSEPANSKGQMLDIGPSEAAKSVVQVISSHTQMLIGSTDKSTLDVFNQEIGLRLFAGLCKHLKRQRISVEGSIKLISDMNHYFRYIQTMKNEELLLYFITLRELSQVYLIDPSDSKEMATIISDGDRFHGIFRAEEVYEFATRRADWYQIKRSVERAMFGIGCSVM